MKSNVDGSRHFENGKLTVKNLGAGKPNNVEWNNVEKDKIFFLFC
jgi:hypothetical protein